MELEVGSGIGGGKWNWSWEVELVLGKWNSCSEVDIKWIRELHMECGDS